MHIEQAENLAFDLAVRELRGLQGMCDTAGIWDEALENVVQMLRPCVDDDPEECLAVVTEAVLDISELQSYLPADDPWQPLLRSIVRRLKSATG